MQVYHHCSTDGQKIDLSSCKGHYWWDSTQCSTKSSLDCLGDVQFASTLSGIYHTLSLKGVDEVGGESETRYLFLWWISLIVAFLLESGFCLLILCRFDRRKVLFRGRLRRRWWIGRWLWHVLFRGFERFWWFRWVWEGSIIIKS